MMGGMEWLLEIGLCMLLAATLFHAVRLERALGVLKRDRAALDELVAGFNGATRAAESGIERLRAAADGAGRHIAKQTETAAALKEDLGFLSSRGEALADRLEQLVRMARPIAEAPRLSVVQDARASGAQAEPRVRSQAERDLIRALRTAR
jgi:hypothetical protein